MLKSLATRTEAASQLVDRSTCSIRATSSSQLKPTQLPTQYSGFCGQFRVILSSPGLSSSIRYAITLIYEPKGRMFESCRAHRKATAKNLPRSRPRIRTCRSRQLSGRPLPGLLDE